MFRPAVSKNKAAIPFKMNKCQKVSELCFKEPTPGADVRDAQWTGVTLMILLRGFGLRFVLTKYLM